MKMKNMIATMTAVALSAFSFAAMTASAAVTEIAYNGPSEGALAVQDDGVSLRLNIFNEWGNNVKDIEKMTAVTDNVTITFTISGLGENNTNKDEAGNPTTPYQAFVCGSIGGAQSFNPGEVGNEAVAINGDGQYTIVWDLPNDSDQINCLLIGTNINIYQYGYEKDQPYDTCGLNITVDSIKTGVADETEPPTEAPTTEAPATTTTTTSTTGASTTTTTGTTGTTGNAATGDSTGIAVALAGLTVAGAVALVSRKRK